MQGQVLHQDQDLCLPLLPLLPLLANVSQHFRLVLPLLLLLALALPLHMCLCFT